MSYLTWLLSQFTNNRKWPEKADGKHQLKKQASKKTTV
jgi:hypothetical protein